MYRANWIASGLLCAVGLSACGTMPAGDGAPPDNMMTAPQPEPVVEEKSFVPPRDCGGDLSSEQRMYLELIYKMEAQGQYHAALAHIDELEKKAESPQTFYLRAEALRQLGQPERAAKYYQLLLGGCMTGYGLHGLGLLSTQAERLAEAETYLKHACRERPVDANVHNDYGMVLLLRGRHEAAKNEFMTALQLDRNNRLSLENLLVLILAEQRPSEARQLAERHGLKEQDFKRLASRARQLKGNLPASNPHIPAAQETGDPQPSGESPARLVMQPAREDSKAVGTPQAEPAPQSDAASEATASQSTDNSPIAAPPPPNNPVEATAQPVADGKSPAESVAKAAADTPTVTPPPGNLVEAIEQPASDGKSPAEGVAQTAGNPPIETSPRPNDNAVASQPTAEQLTAEEELQLDENYEPAASDTATDDPQTVKPDGNATTGASAATEIGPDANIHSSADGKRQTNDSH